MIKHYLNGYNRLTLSVKASLGMAPKLCDSSSTVPSSYVCTIKYYDCKGFHILFKDIKHLPWTTVC